jgi:hypothetical protein
MCHPIWLLSRKYGTVWYHPASSKLWYLTAFPFVNFQEKMTGTSFALCACEASFVRLAVCLALSARFASTNIHHPTRTRFKKRARVRKSNPNIARSSTRHKSHSPRSLEAPTSGGCATSAERRDTLPTRAQKQQRAVALTVTGQTGVYHRSDRCWPGQPHFKQTRQGSHLLQEQVSEASVQKKLQGMV